MSDRYQAKNYKYYVLLFLTLVYTINFIDRQILVILQEPIKAELGLSDTQLGLMTGFAFALFYVVCGIPIARLAEQYSRRNIIAASLTVWSGMTALCGMAGNFWQLLAARIGVGVGEAGGSPPAHSMISDIFSAEQRGTAMSIYSTGINIGILVGFLLGGWVNEYFGWRIAFIVVGLPGILIALLLRFTVQEPARTAPPSDAPSITDAAKYFATRKTFVFISIAAGLQSFMGYATANWMPSMIARVHQLNTGEIGTWMALVMGLSGMIGAVMGGWLADKLGSLDKRWYIWVPAISSIILTPVQLYVYWADNPYLAMGLYALPTLVFSMYLGPVIATCHSLVNSRMRALASAFLFLILNLIGLGMGPLMVGILSDMLVASQGTDSLRWSLTFFNIVVPVIAFACYIKAGKSYLGEIDDEQAIATTPKPA